MGTLFKVNSYSSSNGVLIKVLPHKIPRKNASKIKQIDQKGTLKIHTLSAQNVLKGNE